jgi:predicted transglutaminase-like cysteine proteinase
LRNLLLSVILTFASSVVLAWDADLISASLKDKSPEVLDRANPLLSTIVLSAKLSDKEKLSFINERVNKDIQFQTDIDNWEAIDYWATPVETLTRGAGDCEDYALLKYFSLLIAGVDQSKLKLLYGRTNFSAHMVLVYYECSLCDPLILDNLTDDIKPLTARIDITPIFQFDTTSPIRRWNDVLSRTKSEGFY